MTEARASTPDDQTALSESYRKIGKELGAAVTPVGEAWHRWQKSTTRPLNFTMLMAVPERDLRDDLRQEFTRQRPSFTALLRTSSSIVVVMLMKPRRDGTLNQRYSVSDFIARRTG